MRSKRAVRASPWSFSVIPQKRQASAKVSLSGLFGQLAKVKFGQAERLTLGNYLDWFALFTQKRRAQRFVAGDQLIERIT